MTVKWWWKATCPGSIAFVPGETRADAIECLRLNGYKNAPVERWIGGIAFRGTWEDMAHMGLEILAEQRARKELGI